MTSPSLSVLIGIVRSEDAGEADLVDCAPGWVLGISATHDGADGRMRVRFGRDIMTNPDQVRKVKDC